MRLSTCDVPTADCGQARFKEMLEIAAHDMREACEHNRPLPWAIQLLTVAVDYEMEAAGMDPDSSGTRDYREYLRSEDWHVVRGLALERALGRCQGCNTTEHLETHHRTYDRLGFERADDLTVLCAACHTAVHLVADARRGKVRNLSRRVDG